jgi:pilus assembly protein Flp/PilA
VVITGESNVNKYRTFFLSLLRDDSGQDLIEYALVAALIGLGALASLGPVGNAIAAKFNSIATSITNS